MADLQGNELRKTLSKRFAVLESLIETPQTKPELMTATETSRSTIDRSIADLKEVRCIKEVEGKYQPTQMGRISHAEQTRYIEGTDDIARAGTVLNHIRDSARIDMQFLRDVDVYTSNPHIPEFSLQPSIEKLDDAVRLIGLAPVVLSTYTDLIENRIRQNKLDVEIVIPQAMLRPLLSFSQSISKAVEQGDVVLYISNEELPYALWVMESKAKTVAGITIHENGGVQGLLMNDSPWAVAWARDEYASYRDSATEYQP